MLMGIDPIQSDYMFFFFIIRQDLAPLLLFLLPQCVEYLAHIIS